MKTQFNFLFIAIVGMICSLHCYSQINNSDIKNLKLPEDEKTEKIKADLKRGMDGVRIIDKNLPMDGKPDEFKIYNDRIDFKIKDQSTTFLFSKLLDVKIESIDINKYALNFSLKNEIDLGDFSFYTTNNQRYPIDLRIGTPLRAIQKELTLQRDKILLDSFVPVAENYRKQVVKPEMPEEQRKLIVQANSVSEKKMYNDAIALYEKAVTVDQTSFPPAYFNLALLYAGVKNYYKAIFNMSKYIMLAPDAPDVRSSQDKIYEWELLIK